MARRSASLPSLRGADRRCSPWSAAIGSFCCIEEEGFADDSMGSPPVVEDPVVEKLFRGVNLENKSDYDMIDRMIKGEKLFEPEALTALTPFDVDAITRDADRIIEKVKRRRSSAGLIGSAMKTRRRRHSKNYRSSSDSSTSTSSPSVKLGSEGNKRRGSRRSSRHGSIGAPKGGKGAASKKRAGPRSPKGGDKDVGDGAKSGKTKIKKTGKADGRRHRDEKDRRTDEDKSAGTVSPLEPVQAYPSPVCSLCEKNVHEGNFDFAPCAAYGDYRVNYCTVQKAAETPAVPGEGEGAAATSSVARDKKDQESKDSKVLNGKSVIKRTYRKKTTKDGDKRRTSVCVEETATSEAVELLGGGGRRPSTSQAIDGGPPAKAPSAGPAPAPSAPSAPASSAARAPVHFAVTATTSAAPPRSTVRHYRYAETRRPAGAALGEQQGPQFARPMPPHPLCPVHSPILAGGSPPFPTPYGSPPDFPSPLYPWPNAWWQNTPQSRPLQPWPSAPPDGSSSQRPADPWNPGMQMQQQPPLGGPFPPYGLQQSASATTIGPLADLLGYGPRGAPPIAVPPQWTTPSQQRPMGPQQGSNERGHQQSTKGGNQRPLGSTTADDHRKSPTSMKTYPWFQFPSIPEDLDFSLKWGRTVSQLLGAGSLGPTVKDAAETSSKKKQPFAWSYKEAKTISRRPSMAPSELSMQRRRSSVRPLLSQLRRASAVQEQERTPASRRTSVTEKRRASLANPEVSVEMRRGSTVQKLGGCSSRKCHASVQTNEPTSGCVKKLECKHPGKRPSLVQANESTSAKSTNLALVHKQTKRRLIEQASTCSICRPSSAAFRARRRCHECHHGSTRGSRSIAHTAPTCVAARPRECRQRRTLLAPHGFGPPVIARSRTLEACPLHRATAVCEYIPAPVTMSCTHVCTAAPPLLQPQLSAQLATPVAPIAAGVQPQITTDTKAQSESDLYLLLTSPNGQEKLYQARPLSPVFRVGRSQGELDRAVRRPQPSVSAISTRSQEVDTWQSEVRQIPKRPPLKTTANAELRKMRRCTQGGSSFSTSLSLYQNSKQREAHKTASKRSSLAPTGPDTFGDFNGEATEIKSKWQQVPQKPASKRPSIAPAGGGAGKAVAGDGEEEYMTMTIERDEQPTKISKRPSVAPSQRSAGKSERGGQEQPASVSQKERGSTQSSASEKSKKAKADKDLTQDLERNESRDEDETYVLPDEWLSLLKQSENRSDVSISTTGKANSVTEKSSKYESFAPDAPSKQQDDDAERKESSGKNIPDAKDDEAVKESAEQSAQESAEQSTNENDKPGDIDGAAPVDEAASEEDNEGNAGGEPEPALPPQVAEAAPDAEIRKQQAPASWKYTLYPESRLAIFIGLVCLIWILVVYFIVGPGYQSEHSTENSDPPRTPLTFPTAVTAKPSLPSTVTAARRPDEVPSNVYICSTDRCIDEGERLRRYINRQLSPCENFYQYVCSSWELKTPLRDFGQGVAISTDVLLEETIAAALSNYIRDERNFDVGLTRLLYEACLKPTGNSSAFLREEVFATLPIRVWPYNGTHLKSDDIWHLAGTLIRKYGIVSILDVTIGVQHGRPNRTIELSYPRRLHIKEDYANAEVLETIRSAVLEAAEEFGWLGEAESLISQVISVAQHLADIVDDSAIWEVLVWRFDEFVDSNRDIGVFLNAVFERDVVADTTVVLRNLRPIERLQAFTSTASVIAFLNYLGFRLVVHFSPLLNRDRMTDLQRLAGSEHAGRVLSRDKDWLLCLRLVESVQPACVSKAQAMQQVATGAYTASRIWIGKLEDLFYRNLPRLAWMTERSVSVFNNVVRRFRVARFFAASSLKENHCPQPQLAEFRGRSSISLFVHVAGMYQRWRLRQIGKPTRPRDYGYTLDMRSRYSVAQQAVYLPVGLVGDALPANSTLPVYQASRSAVRLYVGLLPLVYERWDSNSYSEALEVLNGRSASRLAQLLECLEADWMAMPRELRLGVGDVALRAAEARYPLLAQSSALALAYAAFKELLNVERVWKVDFRLQPLAHVTSEQLFFLYYALDNCERSDKPYRSRQFKAWQRLPPEYRVNLPLRHLPQFAQAFQCNFSDGNRGRGRRPPMVAPDGSRCDTVRWYLRASPPNYRRRLAQRGLNADIPSEFLGGVLDVPSTTVTAGDSARLHHDGLTSTVSRP
ncbi:uncharacterized protein [Dermacentor albipictus]|uniref:uncharacterized protein isoform X2 n=1 Tax=Dermacentor albipictus TaxID=60249 RepID=UPI0031FDC27F